MPDVYELGSGEMFNSWQTLVAGADRDTYRRVEGGAYDGSRTMLLSPDGTRVLTFQLPNRLVLLDLATGDTVTMATVPSSTSRCSTCGTARRTGLPDASPAWSAAWSPDGQTLAVQSGPGHAWLGNAEGRRIYSGSNDPYVGDVDLRGRDLIPNVAYSPDGAWLATVSAPGTQRPTIGFVDASGAGRPLPTELPYEMFLGWRSPTSVVVQTWEGDRDVALLAEVSITDGSMKVLSRFSARSTCEFGLHACYPYRIQLASALLPVAGVRAPDPDHGPWPLRVWVWGAVIAFETVGVVWWLLLALRRRRLWE